MKLYEISFSGYIADVEAENEKDAIEQVKKYLYCYAFISAKLKLETEDAR